MRVLALVLASLSVGPGRAASVAVGSDDGSAQTRSLSPDELAELRAKNPCMSLDFSVADDWCFLECIAGEYCPQICFCGSEADVNEAIAQRDAEKAQADEAAYVPPPEPVQPEDPADIVLPDASCDFDREGCINSSLASAGPPVPGCAGCDAYKDEIAPTIKASVCRSCADHINTCRLNGMNDENGNLTALTLDDCIDQVGRMASECAPCTTAQNKKAFRWRLGLPDPDDSGDELTAAAEAVKESQDAEQEIKEIFDNAEMQADNSEKKARAETKRAQEMEEESREKAQADAKEEAKEAAIKDAEAKQDMEKDFNASKAAAQEAGKEANRATEVAAEAAKKAEEASRAATRQAQAEAEAAAAVTAKAAEAAKAAKAAARAAKAAAKAAHGLCANGFLMPATGKPGTEICCAASCGQCGGDGCDRLPGAARSCCGGAILAANRSCTLPGHQACVVRASSPSAHAQSSSHRSSHKDATSCGEWCADEPGGWDEKCAWDSCRGCADCPGAAQREWRQQRQQLEDKGCCGGDDCWDCGFDGGGVCHRSRESCGGERCHGSWLESRARPKCAYGSSDVTYRTGSLFR